ncbi:MAG: portal protein [Hyphomicrobiaceae bacterium]
MAEYDDTEPSQLDDEELFARLKRWFKEDQEAAADWRIEAEESYGFAAGNGQWDEADQAILREQLRPVVTFDRVGPVIDNVRGMEVNNRQEVRYIPRTEGDEQINEVLTGASQWVRDGCDAEDEESDAFGDMLICGVGCTETRLEYETNPDGNVVIERIDPLEMYWDGRAKRRNLDDACRVFRVKEISYAEARDMFPDADDEDLHASWVTGDESEKGPLRDSPSDGYRNSDPAKADSRKKCRIVEAQWWEKATYHRTVDPMTGQFTDLTPEKFKKLEERYEQIAEQAATTGVELPPLKSVQLKKRIYKQAFLGATLLEAKDSPCPTHMTYRFMTGKRDRNKGIWYGLVRGMMDPQRWANKFFSSILHNVATQGKGVIAERTAFENAQQAENDWARPDKIVWAKDGAVAGQKIMPKPAGTFPAGLDKLLEFALMSIRDGTGINTESMGAADREQAGVLEYQRKQSAMTILAPMFDSLRRYRKEQGRVMLYFITEYISDGRLIRIVGEKGAKYVPLVKDEGALEYDVIVDEAPTSPNQKEATWAIMGGLIPLIMKAGAPPKVYTALLKASPLPTSVVEEITGAIEEVAQQPAPPDPALVKVQAQIQADQMKAQSDQQTRQAEMAFEMQMEAKRFELEQVKAENDMRIAVMKAENDMAVSRQKAALELQMQRERGAQEMQMAEATTAASIENQSKITDAKAKATAKAANRPKPKGQ